jgi:hypothetical protein
MDPSRYFFKQEYLRTSLHLLHRHVDDEMRAPVPQRDSAIWRRYALCLGSGNLADTVHLSRAAVAACVLDQDAPARPTLPSELALRWQLCTTKPLSAQPKCIALWQASFLFIK